MTFPREFELNVLKANTYFYVLIFCAFIVSSENTLKINNVFN